MTRAFDVRAVHRCLEMLHKTATPPPPLPPPSLLNASYICHGDALAPPLPAGDKLRIPLTRRASGPRRRRHKARSYKVNAR